MSEVTIHLWRAECGAVNRDAVRRIKELEKENARLKPLVAEKELDILILKRWQRGNELASMFMDTQIDENARHECSMDKPRKTVKRKRPRRSAPRPRRPCRPERQGARQIRPRRGDSEDLGVALAVAYPHTVRPGRRGTDQAAAARLPTRIAEDPDTGRAGYS